TIYLTEYDSPPNSYDELVAFFLAIESPVPDAFRPELAVLANVAKHGRGAKCVDDSLADHFCFAAEAEQHRLPRIDANQRTRLALRLTVDSLDPCPIAQTQESNNRRSPHDHGKWP